MVGSSSKFPLERRRQKRESPSFSNTTPSSTTLARRESDLVRMRLQRWMELADVALTKDGAKTGQRQKTDSAAPTHRRKAA